MSERKGRKACLLLLAAGILLCTVPCAVLSRTTDIFRANSGRESWSLEPVSIETAGGIRINGADADELTRLPKIGETLAAMIVSEREKNGPFHYPEDLASVHGIGSGTVELLRGEIDLTEDESGD